MSRRIDYTFLGGLGVTQDTLDFMQQAYRNPLGALARFLGNKIILFGVVDNGTSFTDGWVCIDGEMMPFVAGLKASNIAAIETVGTEQFADLSQKPVYYTKVARSVALGGYPVADFVRVDTILDIYNGLKNHTHEWAAIQNKPTIPEQKILYVGSYVLGDVVGPDSIVTVSFPDVQTDQYIVNGMLVSLGNNFDDDNDVIATVRGPFTGVSFRLALREVTAHVEKCTIRFYHN